MTWLTDPAHRRWLEGETDRLLEFSRAARHPAGGFGWMDERGHHPTTGPADPPVDQHPYDARVRPGPPDGRGRRRWALVDGGWRRCRGGCATTSTAAGTPRRRGRREAREGRLRALVRAARRLQSARAGRPGARRLLDRALPWSSSTFLLGERGPVRRRLGPRLDQLEATAAPTPTCTRSRRSSRRGRDGRPAVADSRGADRGACDGRAGNASGGCRSTSTAAGAGCPATTGTTRATSSGRSAPPSGTRSSGRGWRGARRGSWSAPGWLVDDGPLALRPGGRGRLGGGRRPASSTPWTGRAARRPPADALGGRGGAGAAAALYPATGDPSSGPPFMRSMVGIRQSPGPHRPRKQGSWRHEL